MCCDVLCDMFLDFVKRILDIIATCLREMFGMSVQPRITMSKDTEHNDELRVLPGSLKYWDTRIDILSRLHVCGLDPVGQNILEHLDLVDLQSCRLVSRLWYCLVEDLWDHHEFNRVGKGWSSGQPKVQTIQWYALTMERDSFLFVAIWPLRRLVSRSPIVKAFLSAAQGIGPFARFHV